MPASYIGHTDLGCGGRAARQTDTGLPPPPPPPPPVAAVARHNLRRALIEEQRAWLSCTTGCGGRCTGGPGSGLFQRLCQHRPLPMYSTGRTPADVLACALYRRYTCTAINNDFKGPDKPRGDVGRINLAGTTRVYKHRVQTATGSCSGAGHGGGAYWHRQAAWPAHGEAAVAADCSQLASKAAS